MTTVSLSARERRLCRQLAGVALVEAGRRSDPYPDPEDVVDAVAGDVLEGVDGELVDRVTWAATGLVAGVVDDQRNNHIQTFRHQ